MATASRRHCGGETRAAAAPRAAGEPTRLWVEEAMGIDATGLQRVEDAKGTVASACPFNAVLVLFQAALCVFDP